MTRFPESRFLDVIWCDDIRLEVGNKPSFMGVYQYLGVRSIPLQVNRLAAFVTLYSPADRPCERLQLRVLKSDEEKPIAEVTTLREKFDVPPSVLDTLEPGEQFAVQRTSVVMLLGDIQVRDTTKWLKVVGTADGEELESLKLRVVKPVPTDRKASE